jgi:hypothetical protein
MYSQKSFPEWIEINLSKYSSFRTKCLVKCTVPCKWVKGIASRWLLFLRFIILRSETREDPRWDDLFSEHSGLAPDDWLHWSGLDCAFSLLRLHIAWAASCDFSWSSHKISTQCCDYNFQSYSSLTECTQEDYHIHLPVHSNWLQTKSEFQTNWVKYMTHGPTYTKEEWFWYKTCSLCSTTGFRSAAPSTSLCKSNLMPHLMRSSHICPFVSLGEISFSWMVIKSITSSNHSLLL